MSRRSFLADVHHAGVLPTGQDGRYAAFSSQGLIHCDDVAVVVVVRA
jgi:hypothetical protein